MKHEEQDEERVYKLIANLAILLMALPFFLAWNNPQQFISFFTSDLVVNITASLVSLTGMLVGAFGAVKLAQKSMQSGERKRKAHDDTLEYAYNPDVPDIDAIARRLMEQDTYTEQEAYNIAADMLHNNIDR